MHNYRHRWLDHSTINLPVGKVVCVGKNYADHIEEMQSTIPDQPVLFIKPSSALRSADHAIEVSHLQHLGDIHHELEISILIGTALNAEHTDVTTAVAGIGLGIDLTLRDVQASLKQQGLPWERAKAFAGSGVLSRFIAFDSASHDLSDLTLTLKLNEETKQHSNSALMLTPISSLLTEIASVFTLEAGDVILTGTPAGVGPIIVGDQLSGQLNQQTLFETNAN
jgi:2-keto-4-pentenoate hydratase/2-oxohepta-3-ene-1,7-dioic acid hydratase in catechol pathway